MKTKLIFGAILIVLVASLAFGGKQFAMNWVAPLFDFRAEIPDHILYETIFRIRTKNRAKAEKDRKEGKADEGLGDLLTNKLDLSEDDDAKLSQAADEFAEAIAPVDERAKGITDEYRKQYPDGKLKENEQPPPPPIELHELQEQRNAIVLYQRDKLQAAIGSTKFEEIDEKVKDDFAKAFRDMSSSVLTRRAN